jgi:putative transposase
VVEASHGPERPAGRIPVWQKGRGYDERLDSERAVREVIDYIHVNPVRRGLAERPTDWYWSSVRFPALGEAGPLAVDRPRF